MLKTRIISAVIGLSLLLAAVFISKETLTIAVFILSVVAIDEFYNAVSKVGHKPVRWIGYLSCIIILLVGFMEGKGLLSFVFVLLLLLLLFPLPVFFHGKYNVADISMTIYSIFYTVFMFSFIVLTRELRNGIFFIWIIFIGAWATDTFAYFGGITFGKTKLIPAVSPNKTLEGSISGVIGSVVAIALYGFFVRQSLNYLTYYHFIIMGVLCGIMSQVGDLTASAIKRYAKIKDYGNIIPGHGGILDRFDSVLLISPIIYLYVYFVI
ncbi:MAG: phosphatidate cytidylyltransferase [Firmicutes bacterium]|nr:phosphatidate cytidylyltransferase [Bacillota bacterium]